MRKKKRFRTVKIRIPWWLTYQEKKDKLNRLKKMASKVILVTGYNNYMVDFFDMITGSKPFKSIRFIGTLRKRRITWSRNQP